MRYRKPARHLYGVKRYRVAKRARYWLRL